MAAKLLGRPTKSRHLQSSCRSSSCFLSSPAVCFLSPCKRFFSDVSTRVGAHVPGSQGSRVPGLQRNNIAPKLPRICREWRAPDTMRHLETSPAATATARHAAAAAAPRRRWCARHPGALSLAFWRPVPGILAASRAIWQCPRRRRGASEASRHRVAWPGCVSPRHSRCSRVARLSAFGLGMVCLGAGRAAARGAARAKELPGAYEESQCFARRSRRGTGPLRRSGAA